MAVTDKKKNWNVFLVNDYEKLRPLLRLLSYGCYSVKDIRQALGKSQSFISHWNGYLTNILPDDRASMTRGKNKKQRLQIQGDSYYGTDNFLAETYFLTSLTTSDFFLFANILRILRKKGRGDGCTLREIGRSLWVYLPSKLEDVETESESPVDRRTLKAKLKLLTANGLIYEEKDHRYHLSKDVLARLSIKQIKVLRFAVDFYRNIAMLEVPGFFLSTLLQARYDLAPELSLSVQLVNIDLRRILDDNTAYQLLCAKEQGRTVSFDYCEPSSQKVKSCSISEVRPEAILFNDFSGSRQLLLDARGQTYRLENISCLCYEAALPDSAPSHPKTPKGKICLRFHCPTMARAAALKRSLGSHLPQVKISPAEGYDFFAVIDGVRDARKYVPFLRQYLPEVEVLPREGSKLRQYMKHSIEEALQNYGEEV